MCLLAVQRFPWPHPKFSRVKLCLNHLQKSTTKTEDPEKSMPSEATLSKVTLAHRLLTFSAGRACVYLGMLGFAAAPAPAPPPHPLPSLLVS